MTGGDGVTIDRLRWWDLAAVEVLERELFGADAWSAGQFWSELAGVPENRWYVAARQAGTLVGYAGILMTGPEADIQTVAVAPVARGRGVGRALVAALLDRAWVGGARIVHLEVGSDNTPARALYERLGFGVVGLRRDYYGPGRDAVLMTWRRGAPGGGDGGNDG